MVMPNLIHPIDVTIKRLNKTELVMDDDAREPMHGARTTAADLVTFKAQIAWGDRARVQMEMGGVEEKSDGYITCRWIDIKALTGGVPKRGDQVVQLGSGVAAIPVNLFITKMEPMGHWPDQGGSTLVRFHFQDRQPYQGG